MAPLRLYLHLARTASFVSACTHQLDWQTSFQTTKTAEVCEIKKLSTITMTKIKHLIIVKSEKKPLQ